MAGWSIGSFLCNIDESAFESFKKEFGETHHYFTESQNQKGLSTACSILFSEKFFPLLDRNQLAELIDALFMNAVKDIHWIAHYMDELVTYLPKDNDAKKLGYEGRADRYYKHIHDTLPNLFKDGLKDGRDLQDDEMREIVRDQVRFVFALHNKWRTVRADANVINDVDLTLNVDETIDELFFDEQLQQPVAEEKKMLGIKVPRISPIQLIPTHSMNGSDKQLAILLTRVLLCDLRSDISKDQEEE